MRRPSAAKGRSTLPTPGSLSVSFVMRLQVFLSPNFRLDDSVHQEVVATVVFRLIGQALHADDAIGRSMQKAMADRVTPQGR
eukprot:363357-Chlamydomonas_euryale.AAC.23